jgi:hypothetical protein
MTRPWAKANIEEIAVNREPTSHPTFPFFPQTHASIDRFGPTFRNSHDEP